MPGKRTAASASFWTQSKESVTGLNVNLGPGIYWLSVAPVVTQQDIGGVIIAPTSGSIQILGHDLIAQPVEVKRQIGVVPEGILRSIVPASPASPDRSEPRGGSETVLLVEDEEMLRELLTSLFEEHGYRVLAAKDGAEGVEIYRSNRDCIALVLSDMGLPKLGGWEMFQQIDEFFRDLNAALRPLGVTRSESTSDQFDFAIRSAVELAQTIDSLTGALRTEHRQEGSWTDTSLPATGGAWRLLDELASLVDGLARRATASHVGGDLMQALRDLVGTQLMDDVQRIARESQK